MSKLKITLKDRPSHHFSIQVIYLPLDFRCSCWMLSHASEITWALGLDVIFTLLLTYLGKVINLSGSQSLTL